MYTTILGWIGSDEPRPCRHNAAMALPLSSAQNPHKSVHPLLDADLAPYEDRQGRWASSERNTQNRTYPSYYNFHLIVKYKMRFNTFPILFLSLVACVVAADDEHTPDRVKCDTAGELEWEIATPDSPADVISTSKPCRLRGTIEQRRSYRVECQVSYKRVNCPEVS